MCTSPTGFFSASITNRLVIFSELSCSSASDASASGSMVLGALVITAPAVRFSRSGDMLRRRSPSVTMPISLPSLSSTPRQP